jgi:hypothetical protein
VLLHTHLKQPVAKPAFSNHLGERQHGAIERAQPGCSGLIKPDTFLGGNITTMKEVFNDKHTTIVYNRL